MAWLDISTLASIATAISVILLLAQIIQSGRRTTTKFEDELAREYRDIVNELPVEALLGEQLTRNERQENLHDFYRYIDLSNEQIFLRQENKVSKQTWMDWCQGIESNLKQPEFRRAWSEIKRRSKSFSELRKLEQDSFDSDPYLWNDNIRKQAKRDIVNLISIIRVGFWITTWIVISSWIRET